MGYGAPMSRLSAILLAGLATVAGVSVLALVGVVPPVAATVTSTVVLLGLVALVGLGSARPGWALFGPAITRADSGRPEIALTFDDGPDPASTPALLRALDEARARATFYLLADRVETHPGLARAIAEHHEVGVHGASHHPWLTVRDPGAGAAELGQAARRIAEITGVRPTTFRPPFGATSPRLAEAARRAGLTVVWCSVRTGDGGHLDPDTLRARCRQAGPGDIVLLHEGPRAARVALPEILADLAGRGLRPVTVTELLS